MGVNVGGSNVTFEDNLSYVNPNIFNGNYYKTSIGAALGIGYGGSLIQLGGAKTSAGGGLLGGIDVSMAYSFAPGLSTVMEQKVENCDCENN